MATIATFALKAGVWFRRGRLLIVSPDSLGTACPLSGRNSTYRPVQILEASSVQRSSLNKFHVCAQTMEIKISSRTRRSLICCGARLLEEGPGGRNTGHEP